jgi:hypothetical protein
MFTQKLILSAVIIAILFLALPTIVHLILAYLCLGWLIPDWAAYLLEKWKNR